MNNDISIDIGGAYLTVVQGPGTGRRIDISDGEATIGRASENDISLPDPILSRKHCRMTMEGSRLTIEDLDSANGTFVNGHEIKSAILHNGDEFSIGDTVIRVGGLVEQAAEEAAPQDKAQDKAPLQPPPAQAADKAGAEKAGAREKDGVVIDLGLGDKVDGQSAPRQANWRPLLWSVAALFILLLVAWRLLLAPQDGPSAEALPQPPPKPSVLPFSLEYEKVEASGSSVFRYSMSLSEEGALSVAIDDLAEPRHVRKEKKIAESRVEELAKEITTSGFTRLLDSYEGLAAENTLSTLEISYVSNLKTKKVRIMNRVEPEEFRSVREMLETFGKNELGIWAIQFSPEKLVELASQTFTRACNFFDQRDNAFGNLYESIRRFEEAEFYLETIEPKPDFYKDIVTGLEDARSELAKAYENQNFKADHAIRSQNWDDAARELRILRELIPDTSDERNAEAARKLLDVENRQKAKKKK